VAYDTSGRIASEATGGVTTAYGYDPAGQLLSVTPTAGHVTVHTYDQLGRRATTKIGAAAATTNTYDPTGALLSGGGSTYTYDLAGRRLTEAASGNNLTYVYNAAGQLATLTRVQGAVTTTQSRTYDATGTLATVANVTGNTTTMDWDPTGGVAQLLGMTAAGTTDIVQGVTGLAVSKVGVTFAAYGIDQYGSAITGTQARSTSCSLTYLRARDYQAGIGLFTSADPVEGKQGATTVNNRLHYVDNMPLQRVDPSGMFSVGERGSIDVRPGGGQKSSGSWWSSILGKLPSGVALASSVGVDIGTEFDEITQYLPDLAAKGKAIIALAAAAKAGASGAAGAGASSLASVVCVGAVPGVVLGVGIYKLNPGGYATAIDGSCSSGGPLCTGIRTVFLGPVGTRVLDWWFTEDDPAPKPAAAGTPPTTAVRKPPCSTNDVKSILDSLPKGKQSGVHTVDSDVALQALFDQLSAGGIRISRPSYDGQWVRMNDGCEVGLRNSSTSGGRTIDVRSSDGISRWKVHIT
jgi:RHS repeat-associated protein